MKAVDENSIKFVTDTFFGDYIIYPAVNTGWKPPLSQITEIKSTCNKGKIYENNSGV